MLVWSELSGQDFGGFVDTLVAVPKTVVDTNDTKNEGHKKQRNANLHSSQARDVGGKSS